MTDIPEVTEALDGLRMTAADGRMPIVLAGLIERDVATLSDTIEKLTKERVSPLNQPPFWTWEVAAETTPSGKQLFRCSICGQTQPTPDKWQYHADDCFREVTDELASLRSQHSRDEAVVEAAKPLATGGRGSVCALMEDWYCSAHNCDDDCVLAPVRRALSAREEAGQ